MKLASTIILIFTIFYSCSTLKYIAPRPDPPRKTTGGIMFEYYAPSAKIIVLAGEFNNWEHVASEKAIVMKKREDGIWWVIVPLKPGRYKYKFIIDNTKWEKNPYGEDANDQDNNSLIIVE